MGLGTVGIRLVDTDLRGGGNWGSRGAVGLVVAEEGGCTWKCFLTFLLKGLRPQHFVSVSPTPEGPQSFSRGGRLPAGVWLSWPRLGWVRCEHLRRGGGV